MELAEITHEALLRHWTSLQEWVDASRDDHKFHRRLNEAAHHWNTNEQAYGLLWRSPDLERLADFEKKMATEMTELEVQFTRASARQERVRSRQRRFILSATIVVVTLVVLLVIRIDRQQRQHGTTAAGLFGLLGASSAAAAPFVGRIRSARPRSILIAIIGTLAGYVLLLFFGRTLPGLIAPLRLSISACNRATSRTSLASTASRRPREAAKYVLHGCVLCRRVAGRVLRAARIQCGGLDRLLRDASNGVSNRARLFHPRRAAKRSISSARSVRNQCVIA